MEYVANKIHNSKNKKKEKEQKIFTPEELSKYIDLSADWIRERIKRRELECSISNNPPYAFTIIDICNFLNRYSEYYDKIKMKGGHKNV